MNPHAHQLPSCLAAKYECKRPSTVFQSWSRPICVMVSECLDEITLRQIVPSDLSATKSDSLAAISTQFVPVSSWRGAVSVLPSRYPQTHRVPLDFTAKLVIWLAAIACQS